MASLRCNLLLLTLVALAAAVSAHNITAILEGTPEYSQYNSFLTQTRLADEINTRTTVTVLVLTNGVMSSLAAKHPLSVIKNALSLHILLDYYDPAKLHKISDGSVLTTTLYQTTGHAPGNLGFVNITDLQGGKVGFGSAAPGSKLDSSYTKSVKQIPYNISVLEISSPVIAPEILTAPAHSASDLNITALLEKAGCKTFAALIVSSGLKRDLVVIASVIERRSCWRGVVVAESWRGAVALLATPAAGLGSWLDWWIGSMMAAL